MTVKQAKEDVCKKFGRITGQDPTGLSDILSIITGPDVLPLLEKLIKEVKQDRI